MKNNPENIIKYIICNYSTEYPTRYSVLRHLFFTNGNGSYWSKDGFIKIEHEESFVPIDKSIDNLRNIKLLLSSNEDISSLIDFKILYREKLLQFTTENIELITSSYFYYEDSQKPTYDDFSKYVPNNLLKSIPVNIHISWKIVIIEFLSLIISDISKIYSLNNKLRYIDDNSIEFKNIAFKKIQELRIILENL